MCTFQWCTVRHENGSTSHCVDDALHDLALARAYVTQVAVYEHEERLTPEAMLTCPEMEKMIVADRIYMRLVLPNDDQ